MTGRTDLQVDIWPRDPQGAEKRIRERVIVVLAGMDDGLLDARSRTGAVNGGELREVGSRPNEMEQFDGIGPRKARKYQLAGTSDLSPGFGVWPTDRQEICYSTTGNVTHLQLGLKPRCLARILRSSLTQTY